MEVVVFVFSVIFKSEF